MDILKLIPLDKLFCHFPISFQLLIIRIREFVSNIRSYMRDPYNDIELEDILAIKKYVEEIADPSIKKKQSDSLILLDFFPLPIWSTVNLIAAGLVARKTGARIATLDFYAKRGKGVLFLKALGVHDCLRYKKERHLELSLSILYRSLIFGVKSSRDLLDYEINGINVGLDIYESFLRSGEATGCMNSFKMRRTIYQGLKQFISLKVIFEENRVDAVFASHENFLGPGLLSKFAFKYQRPLFFMNQYEINSPNELFENHSRYIHYPRYFDALSYREKVKGIRLAQEALARRITGEVGVMMSYQIESAFAKNIIERQLAKSNNKKILILSHDFFDNPHAFQKMVYEDFLLWMNHLAELASEFPEIEWYVKIHKDHSQVEEELVRLYCKKHKHIKWVSPATNFHQLSKEGLTACITCFGSVGHELPLLDVEVINCSFNPHIAYSFNSHCLDKESLRKRIQEISKGNLRRKFNHNQLYEFFYVHNYLNHPENFNVGVDLVTFQTKLVDRPFYNLARYCVNNFQDIEIRTSHNFRDAVNTRRKYSIEQHLKKSDWQVNNCEGMLELHNLMNES